MGDEQQIHIYDALQRRKMEFNIYSGSFLCTYRAWQKNRKKAIRKWKNDGLASVRRERASTELE
jgi:hypothetical protein